MKATIKQQSDGTILLSGVVLSYPNLIKPGLYKGVPKANLDSSLLLDAKKDKDVIKQLMGIFVKEAKKLDPNIKKLSSTLNPKLVKSPEGLHWIVQTTNSIDYPPIIFDDLAKIVRDPAAEGYDRKLYAGAYVKVKLTLNPNDSTGEVKVWCNLAAIQFIEHGEKLGGGMSDKELTEGFGEVETDFDKSQSDKSSADDDIDDDDDFDFDEDDI